MKTYTIVQVVEMSVSHKVRARNAAEANEIASQRTGAICHSISRKRRSVNFGDITDDYIPARDEDDE